MNPGDSLGDSTSPNFCKINTVSQSEGARVTRSNGETTVTEKVEKQTAKLTIEKVKGFRYSKAEKVDPKTGQKMYPKDIWWDIETPGFGVRIFPTGTKSYVYKYRNEANEQKFFTIGDTREITLHAAREEAVLRAGDVIKGVDPAKGRHDKRHGRLMSELCEQFVSEHTIGQGHTKRRIEDVQSRIKKYILPAFGSKQVQNITTADIQKLRHKIGIEQKHQVLANCIRQLLSTMFDRAKVWGYVGPEFVNPTKEISDFKERERELYVFPEHMSILAKAIENEANTSAKLAIWMFLLTGKRKMEILSAKWDNIDESAKTLYIPTTKTGEQEQLPLNEEAWAIIQRAKKIRKVGNPYIFPGLKENHHLVNIQEPWKRIRDTAIKAGASSLQREVKLPSGETKVEHVVIHGLRHTAAVWLVNHADADTGLVGKILNHKSGQATRRYAKFKIQTKERALQDLGSMISKASKTKPGKVVSFGTRTKKN
jgi:integrase